MQSTYTEALAAGDRHVYFIPGPKLVEGVQDAALVDNCHPADVGFFSMARVVGAKLAEILFAEKGD